MSTEYRIAPLAGPVPDWYATLRDVADDEGTPKDVRVAAVEALTAYGALRRDRRELYTEQGRTAREIARLRAELASTRRELSESLVARARLDGRAPTLPSVVSCPHCTDGFTAEDIADGDLLVVCTMCAKAGRSAATPSQLQVAPSLGVAPAACSKCGTTGCAEDAASGWYDDDAPALARSVPSVTAQTEENETRGR